MTFISLWVNFSAEFAKGQGMQLSGAESENPVAQTYKGYVAEFKKATSSSFTETDLNRIFSEFSALVMTGIDTTELVNSIEGKRTSYFPLEKLRDEPFYSRDIKKLLDSKNECQRVFAYITIASAGDRTFNDSLLKAAKTENSKGGKLWSGLGLLYLQDNHTSELFDFLVENEDFGDAHMMPFYMRLNKDLLRQTAFEKINSKNEKAKILAVQSLSVTGLDPKTAAVVKEAVKNWEPSTKGYAIYTLKALGVGDLKSLLAPLLKSKDLRGISLEALANSPTPADQEYLSSLIPADGEVPNDILDAYFSSTRKESVSKWLLLVRDRKVAPKYFFMVFHQPLLSSDDMIDEVRNTLSKTKNHQVLSNLVRALEKRNDDASIKVLIDLLSDSDSTVRHWAAFSLKGKTSPLLADRLPDLIKNPNLRTTAFTELAIQNKINGLQDVYDGLLKGPATKSSDWDRSSLQYLAAFPRAKDKDLFKSILQSDKDVFVKRSAVTGLGELHDLTSIDLIVAALKQEPPRDLNAVTYLVALSKIKGEKAKQIVESYKNSQNDSVRNLVAKLLAEW